MLLSPAGTGSWGLGWAWQKFHHFLSRWCISSGGSSRNSCFRSADKVKKAALHAQLESNRKQSGTLHWVWQSWSYVSYLFVLCKKQNAFFLILEHVYLLRTQNLTGISTNASPISCPIWSTVWLFGIVHVCMCTTHCVVYCVFVCICAYIRAGLQIEKWQMNYCHTKVWYPNVYWDGIYLLQKILGWVT